MRASGRTAPAPPTSSSRDPWSSREVGDAGTRVSDAARRLLPFLLAAERGEIEEVVGASQRLCPSRVHRVGVEDVVSVAEEHAVPGLLRRSVAKPTHADL